MSLKLHYQILQVTKINPISDVIMSNFGIHLITILFDWYIEVLINLWMTLVYVFSVEESPKKALRPLSTGKFYALKFINIHRT